MIKYLGNVLVDFLRFSWGRCAWGCYLIPPPLLFPTHTTPGSLPWGLVVLGAHPPPSSPINAISSAVDWPNRSQTIFQPTSAFVSKQLYLLGYGLFLLHYLHYAIFFHYLYSVETIRHTIVNSVQVILTRELVLDRVWMQGRRSYFILYIYIKD